MEGDEPLYEFPPAQSLNRGIIQEQAEVTPSPTHPRARERERVRERSLPGS